MNWLWVVGFLCAVAVTLLVCVGMAAAIVWLEASGVSTLRAIGIVFTPLALALALFVGWTAREEA